MSKAMMFLLVLCLVLAAGCGVGCSYVTPADQAVIHANYQNAVAINAKVQVDPACPAYAKVWWDAEAKTWVAMDAWAKGVKFPTTAPAGK